MGIGFNVKLRGQIFVRIFWSCLQPGSGLQVQKGIFLTEKPDSVIVIHIYHSSTEIPDICIEFLMEPATSPNHLDAHFTPVLKA